MGKDTKSENCDLSEDKKRAIDKARALTKKYEKALSLTKQSHERVRDELAMAKCCLKALKYAQSMTRNIVVDVEKADALKEYVN
jgi:hypothetical protein